MVKDSTQLPLKDSCLTPEEGFEGPEKNLEIDFRPKKENSASSGSSFRSVKEERWSSILSHAQCCILSKVETEKLTAYLLSESSLFVFDEKIILKTCGKTTLLKTIPYLLSLAAELDFCVDFVRYSRPFFLFPCAQNYPHDSFDSEVQYMEKFFRGHSYTLGTMDGKTAWHLYVADQSEKYSSEQTFEIIMFDLDANAVSCFFKEKGYSSGMETLECSNLISLLPNGPETQFDAFNFDPCGFSLNAVYLNTYYTIHITPESHCSYASFECNANMDDFTPLLTRTLEILKPKKYCVVFFADFDAPAACMKQPLLWSACQKYCYQQCGEVTFLRMNEGNGEYCAQVCSFVKNSVTEEQIVTMKEQHDSLSVASHHTLDNCVFNDTRRILYQVADLYNAVWYSQTTSTETKIKANCNVHLHRPLLFIDLGVIYGNFSNIQKVSCDAYRLRYSVRCNPDPAVLKLLDGLGVQLSVSSRSEVEHLIRNDISLQAVVFSSPMLKLSSIQRLVRNYSFGLVSVVEDLFDEPIGEELLQILRKQPIEICLSDDDTFDAIERLERVMAYTNSVGIQVVSVDVSQQDVTYYLCNLDRFVTLLQQWTKHCQVVIGGQTNICDDDVISRSILSTHVQQFVSHIHEYTFLSANINTDGLLLLNSQMIAVSVIARQESPSSCHHLTSNDNSIERKDEYYISEGVFGAFHERMTDATVDWCPYPLVDGKENELSCCSIYGPSGDKLDHIWSGTLPVLQVHDYLVFPKISSFLSLGLQQFNDFSRKVDTKYIVTVQ
eukprot:jgi/Galph1/1029/GphlegSOOS_G5882.1